MLLKASGIFSFFFFLCSSLLIRSLFTVRNNEDMRYIKKWLRERKETTLALE